MKTVLITGGSSGIGYELSKHFAQNGYRLLWVAKPPEELAVAQQKLKESLSKAEIHTLALDLSNTEAPKAVYEWAKGIGEIDVLINNAGFGTYGYQSDIVMDKELAMMAVNMGAVYQLTRLFLDDMTERNAGTIINISSTASFQPIARMNTYAATKAFVKHFSMGLQEELELQKSKVKVLTVCPAAIKNTNFQAAGNMKGVKTFNGLAYTTVEEVASDIWKGFLKKQPLIITGKKARLLINFVSPLLPYRLQQYLVHRETEME